MAQKTKWQCPFWAAGDGRNDGASGRPDGPARPIVTVALFWGGPGTGKSAAAEALGFEFGRVAWLTFIATGEDKVGNLGRWLEMIGGHILISLRTWGVQVACHDYMWWLQPIGPCSEALKVVNFPEACKTQKGCTQLYVFEVAPNNHGETMKPSKVGFVEDISRRMEFCTPIAFKAFCSTRHSFAVQFWSKHFIGIYIYIMYI